MNVIVDLAPAQVLGALVNAVFLVALCFSITVESLKRFYEPEEIHNPEMILWVGTMGLIVNLIGNIGAIQDKNKT